MQFTDTSDYDEEFADRYDELVDWDRRMRTEYQFLVRLLKERGCRRVLDVAAGTGRHAVALAEDGFDVVATDGSPAMVDRAARLVRQKSVQVPVAVADWRHLRETVRGRFDAVLCLGNSFSHLLAGSDRDGAVREFCAVLNSGGLACIDHRNYRTLVANDEEALLDNHYCSDEIVVVPKVLEDGRIELSYRFRDGYTKILIMYPIQGNELVTVMRSAGFAGVETFADYGEPGGGLPPASYLHVGQVVNGVVGAPST